MNLNWNADEHAWEHLEQAIGYVGEDRSAAYILGCIEPGVSMSYLNGEVLTDLLLGHDRGLAAECPFVNRRVIPWPASR